MWKKFSHNTIIYTTGTTTVDLAEFEVIYGKEGLELYEKGKESIIDVDIYN